jgi:hypothetical protein
MIKTGVSRLTQLSPFTASHFASSTVIFNPNKKSSKGKQGEYQNYTQSRDNSDSKYKNKKPDNLFKGGNKDYQNKRNMSSAAWGDANLFKSGKSLKDRFGKFGEGKEYY